MTTRDRVLEAFKEEENFCFSYLEPFEYTNDIDNMAWIGAMTGAALKAGDMEVAYAGIRHLTALTNVGPDARTYYPTHKRPVGDAWIESKTMPGYSYKQKPQAYAGPFAYLWASKQSENVTLPAGVEDKTNAAKAFVTVAPLFGWLIKWWPRWRQHINTVMFAHLLLGKRPPESMKFLAWRNPLYSYLYGERMVWTYPNTGDWPAKDWPTENPKIDPYQTYTPICQLTADLLQSTL